MKRNELAQLLEVTPVQLDSLLKHFPQVDPLSDDIPDVIAEQLLNKFENSRALSGDTPVAQVDNDASLMKMIDSIDVARSSTDINRENTQGQHDYIIEESLVQAEIEGELAGELEAITFLNSYHEGRSSVLKDYTSYKQASHDKFLKRVLSKYQTVSSQESEKTVKNTMEYDQNMKDIRAKLRSKKR